MSNSANGQVLVPRLYQTEMLARAEDRNTIVRLDTGTGKSLIAIMLIRIMSSRLSTAADSDAAKKMIIFIVPTRELVTQQTKSINSQLQLVVKGLRGDDQIDFWDTARWQTELQGVHVLVCTAQIFYNMICHAYIKMTDVSLLIFDECHHAAKNHPYAQIMHEGYHRFIEINKGRNVKHLLPRILGLTASPIYNTKNPLKGIQDLEAVLDATVAEVQTYAEELKSLSRRPVERLEYFMPSLRFAGEASTFREMLRDSPADRFFVQAVENKLDAVASDLGSLSADIFVSQWLSRFLLSSSQGDVLAAQVHEIAGMKELADRFEGLLKLRIVSEDNCTPKVTKLLHILRDYERTPDFMALVFAQTRPNCAILARIITMTHGLEWIQSDYLVGHGENVSSALSGLDSKQQARVVQRFRKGELNLLVCSQIAEEGLDFPACRCVIRFDVPQTITSYIQSRGRARAANSELVIMVQKNSADEIMVKQFPIDEKSLQPHYNYDHDANPDGENEAVLNGQQFPIFAIESGAMLTFTSAIPLLHEFCSLLPVDDYTPICKPFFSVFALGESFQATLSLPVNIYVQGEQRSLVGPLMPTKMTAKQAVAFEAIQMLYDADAFNEHLLPVREEHAAAELDGHAREIDLTQVDMEVESLHHNLLGNLHDPGSGLFLHKLSFGTGTEREYHIGLLAGNFIDLNEEPGLLFDRISDEPLQFQVTEVQPVLWAGDTRAQRLASVASFNHSILQIACNRRYVRKYTEVPLYQLVVPLKAASMEIDWDLVEEPFGAKPNASTERGTLLVAPNFHRLRRARFFHLEQYRPDLALDTRIEKGMLLDNQPAELYTYGKFFRDIEKAYKLDFLQDNEALLEVSSTRLPVSYLRPQKDDLVHATLSGILPESICHVSRLDLGFWRILRMLPSWSRLIVDRMRVTQTMKELDLPPIRQDLVLQALTLPSCAIGYDYETLETVGDCFLKLATSIQVFNKWPSKQEGFMSQIRRNSIDNQFLRKHALNLDLPQYFISDVYKAAEVWTPPTLDCDPVDGGLSLKRMVARRTLSDVMEALLGAAIATAGVEMGLAVGTKLQMCFGGQEHWSTRYEQAEPRSNTLAPNLEMLEVDLDYKFRNNRLLLEALMHRSCPSASLASRSYERLEFLGDAVIDFYVVQRAYRAKPDITPQYLSNFKQTLVSNGSLAYLAITKLSLQKCVLHGSNSLTAAHARAEHEVLAFSDRPYYESVFLWDPPKTLADCFEAIIGAILVDCNYNLEVIDEVLTRLMDELFHTVPLDCPDDPISQLRHIQQGRYCHKLTSKAEPRPADQLCTWNVISHGKLIGTHAAQSRYVAEQGASLNAVEWFKAQKPVDLDKLCPCKIRQVEQANLLNRAKAEAKKAEKDAAYQASLLEPKELDDDDDMDED